MKGRVHLEDRGRSAVTMKKTIISLVAIATLAVGLQAQAPAKTEKNWKDRAEYDLYSEDRKSVV